MIVQLDDAAGLPILPNLLSGNRVLGKRRRREDDYAPHYGPPPPGTERLRDIDYAVMRSREAAAIPSARQPSSSQAIGYNSQTPLQASQNPPPAGLPPRFAAPWEQPGPSAIPVSSYLISSVTGFALVTQHELELVMTNREFFPPDFITLLEVYAEGRATPILQSQLEWDFANMKQVPAFSGRFPPYTTGQLQLVPTPVLLCTARDTPAPPPPPPISQSPLFPPPPQATPKSLAKPVATSTVATSQSANASQNASNPIVVDDIPKQFKPKVMKQAGTTPVLQLQLNDEQPKLVQEMPPHSGSQTLGPTMTSMPSFNNQGSSLITEQDFVVATNICRSGIPDSPFVSYLEAYAAGRAPPGMRHHVEMEILSIKQEPAYCRLFQPPPMQLFPCVPAPLSQPAPFPPPLQVLAIPPVPSSEISTISDSRPTGAGQNISNPIVVDDLPKQAKPKVTKKVDTTPRLEPKLNDEQAALVELICSGRNVFYTGSAGCGKSTVLKAFVKRLRLEGKQVDIIAPTGRAALEVNGTTLMTYAGWIPDSRKKPIDELEREAIWQKWVNKRMKKTDVLVIDEISMVENELLERLNRILKAARNSSRPFGGLQLVVTGDFCQLPPVKPFEYCMMCGKRNIEKKFPPTFECRTHGSKPDTDKWAFRSNAWKEADLKHVTLRKIHRQSDKIFIDILQKLRVGIPITPEDKDLLLDHPNKCSTTNSIRLFPTRAEVKRVNDEAFAKLVHVPARYSCLDNFRWNEKIHPNLRNKGRRLDDGSLDALKDHRLEAQIDFKLGMLVVLLTNLDLPMGLVNGSQGKIVGWEQNAMSKLPKAFENAPKRKRLDPDSPDKKGSKSSPSSSQPTSFPIEPPILYGDYSSYREEQIKLFIRQQPVQKWPIVLFSNGQRRTIYADCRVHEIGDDKPYSLLSRTQIPLMAAWAMTIHKSQGMTLDRVIVDLSRSFEEGQEYVALSRARSLEGLKVEGLGVCGEGNREVREFLEGRFGMVC